MFDEIELAWAAGFFDGEGSVGLHKLKTGRKYVSLNVVNTYKPNVERFYKAVGCIGYMGVRKRREKHWKICYYWQTQKDALKVFNLLKPYLNNEKKNRFEEYYKLEDRRPDLMARRGEDNARTKITNTQALEIRKSIKTTKELCNIYGVERQIINNIRSGRTWKHLPLINVKEWNHKYKTMTSEEMSRRGKLGAKARWRKVVTPGEVPSP